MIKTTESLDREYQLWLYSEVENRKGLTSSNHSYLIDAMHSSEFYWDVPMDSNREADGRALRRDFMLDQGVSHAPREWLEYGASFLEVTVALAGRMAIMTDEPAGLWFWKIMDNCGLYVYNNDDFDPVDVEDIIYNVINRKYDEDGIGGFFPLEDSHQDQTQVELLYQMYSYINEYYD